MRFTLALKAFTCIFFLQAAVIATNAGLKVNHVSGCHNDNVMLNCPLYQKAQSESDSVELEWKIRNKTWTKIAAIDGEGNRSLLANGTSYQDRITVYPNGSLAIASLDPEDERQYLCKVGSTKGPKHYLVQLNVTCSGKVTVIKREVCVEEDVVLECEAKHRTNPRKLKQLTWHVKNASSTGSDVSWSPIVDSDEFSIKTGDGFKLNQNGSLSLQSRARDHGEVTYRCEASKKVDSSREMHLIVLKNVKCGIMRGKREADKLSPREVCTGHHLELVCPLLNPVNISDVRSLKWRVHRTGSPKHFQPLFHVKPKKASNETIFVQTNLVRNTTRLHDFDADSVTLKLNGSLLIKSVRDVDGGVFECIVKTHHHKEPHRYVIRVKTKLCNDTKGLNAENITVASTTFVLRPTTIKTSAGRVAMTTAPARGFNISIATENATQGKTSKKEEQESIDKISSLPTSANQSSQTTGWSKIADSLSQIKTTTSTSTWTVTKPSLKTIRTTTKITTFTSFSSSTAPEDEGDLDSNQVQIASTDFEKDRIVCGGNSSNPVGTFQSPNYPSAYPANSHCEWTISVSQGYSAINITLDHFDLEDEENCRRDYVAIFDKLGNQVGPRRCGIIDSPTQFQVKGRVVVVVFQSDVSLQKAGFKLSYKSEAQSE